LPVAAAGGVAGTATEPGFAGLSSTGLSFLPQAGSAETARTMENAERNFMAADSTASHERRQRRVVFGGNSTSGLVSTRCAFTSGDG